MSVPRSVKLLLMAILTFATSTQLLTAQDTANDDKILQAYKFMLSRTPKEGKEGSPFDRLYRLYLEGPGLEKMVADYQAETQKEPANPSPRLILGHIYKRLGQDDEALVAYKKSVALAPTDYYSYLALGQMCFTLRRYEDAIASLTQAAGLFQESDSEVSTEELISIYKLLGRAYFNRDRVDEAITAWEKIAELAPANIFARVELAELFREQKLYELAIDQHHALIEIKRDDPYRICLSLREIGSIQEEVNEYHQAINTYNEALTLTAPDNWIRKDLQDRIIAIYAATGDWDGLIEYYQKKLVDTPKNPELISLLADAYLENEQVDAGIAQYQKSVELAPTSVSLRRKLIDALRRTDKLAEAAAEYETLSIQVPDDFGIYRSLGALYLQLEQPDRAHAAYERLLARDPENARTHLTLAEIYAEHKWFDEAVAAYEKAIELAPANLDYIEYLGEFFFRRGNHHKALETWNRLVEGERAVAQNYERLAQLLHAKEFRVEAVAASRRAVELAPTEYRYREMLAKQLMDAKNFDAAISQFAEAEKYAPNDFFAEQMAAQQMEVYRRQGVLGDKIAELQTQPQSFDGQKLLATMYLKMRNTTAAAAALEKALELNPDDIPTNRSLAEFYAQLRQHDKAKAAYARLVILDGVNAREYYANLARAHLGVMNFNAAKEASRRMLAHSPRNPEGHQMLAKVALAMGDYPSAIESLEQAIRLRPQATEIRVELAEAYRLADDLRRATEQYWRCWELSDNASDKLRFVRPLSNAYYDMGRRLELSEKLQQMSRANSSDMAPVLALAEVYRLEGDLSASRVQLARALDRNRNNSDLLSQLVDISLKIGDLQDALIYQQRLARVEPDARNQRRLGILLFDLGREQEAVQVWTKMLHEQSQSLDALIKLTELLIEYDLRPLAFSAVDRIAEQARKPQSVYRLGTILLEIGESERARPYFEHILHMPRPQSPQNTRSTVQTSPFVQDPLRHIVHIGFNAGQQFRGRGGQGQRIWLPQSFEDTQIAALAQLLRMAREREELEEFINGFEAEAAASPKDLQRLERLLYIYMLSQNEKKAADVLSRLVALSPNDPTYHKMRFQLMMWDHNFDYETVEGFLSQIPETMYQVRLQYTVQSAMRFIQTGKRSVAQKLLRQFKNGKPTDFTTGTRLITAFSQLGDTETAENLLANLPAPSALQPSAPSGIINPRQMWRQYADSYRSLAGAYIEKGQTDKAVELLWLLFKQPQSHINTSHWMGSSAYTSYRNYSSDLIYPAPNTYYDRSRFELLQQLFGYLLLKDQLDFLYTKLHTVFGLGGGRERILSGLALSYCYWWEGRRDESQQLLETLLMENSGDLTLKRHMPLVMIQTGRQKAAISLLTELAESDPRNHQQYNNLRFFLAEQRGNTTSLQELATDLLNSPASVRELMNFSQQLHEIGLTQYAIAIAKRAADIAIGQNDLSSLRTLSRRLKTLGRGHDATVLTKHVARFTKLPARPGQRRFRRGHAPPPTPEEVRLREPELVEAVEKRPNSVRARLDLTTYYENTDRQKKAIPILAGAVALRSKDSALRYRYAEMLRREKQMDLAVEQYAFLLKSDPNFFRDRGHHSSRVRSPIEIFMEAGKFTELVALAQEMTPVSIDGYESTFVESVAWQCVKNNASEDAIELFEKLIEMRPDWSDFHLGLSHAYAAAGEREQAVECIRNGLNEMIQSGSSTLHPRQLKDLVSELINLNTGMEAYNTFINELELKLETQSNNLSLTWLIAYMYIQARQLEPSDALVAKLLETEQDITDSELDSEWFTTLADSYHQAGNFERQMKVLEAVVEKRERQTAFWNFNGGIPFHYYELLGESYVQNGEKEKAQRLFRKIIPMLMALSWWSVDDEKQGIAQLYIRLHMWDEAEPLFSEIASNVFTDVYRRERAQKELTRIRKERGDFPVTPQSAEEIRGMDIRSEREKALRYTRRGEFEKAVEIYKQLIASIPEDHRSVAALAKLYTKQEMHDEAISTWQSLLKVDRENTQYRSELAEAYRAADMFPEALEIVQKLIEENPSIDYYSQLALVYMIDNRFDDAVAAYRKAIELAPNSSRVYKDLGQLYAQTGDLDAAEKTYKTALQVTNNNRSQRIINIQLAEVYIQQSELDDALKKMKEEGLLTLATLNGVAEKYRKRGELEKASALYTKGAKLTTDKGAHSEIAEILVRIYREQGRLEEILKKAKEADTPAADIDTQVQKVLAKQYMETGELEKISELAKQVILHDPEDHGFRTRLAEYYSKKQKRGDMAVAVLTALIEDAPKETYQDQLIDTYADFKRYPEAIALAQELCVANPSSYRYVRLARVYDWSNHLDGAIEAYKKAIKIDFVNDSQIYQDAHRELGRLYVEKEDFEAAEKVLKAVGEDNWLLIEVYRNLGKWEEVLKRAEAQGTRSVVMLEELATHYHRGGKLAQAATAYRKLLRMMKKQDSDYERISDRLVQIYRQQSDWEQAIKRAETEGILTSELLNQQAQAYRKQGKLEKAIAAYKKAVDINLQGREADQFTNEMISLYLELGDFNAAIALYEGSVSNFDRTGATFASYTPSSVETHLPGDNARRQIIEAYKQRGRLQELVTYFEGRFTQEPKSPAIVEMLAETYNHLGEHGKAAEKYHQLSELQPTKLRTFYLAAIAFNRSGQPERTEEMLNHGTDGLSAYRLDHYHRIERSQEHHFLRTVATICTNGGLYDTAIKFAEDAIIQAHKDDAEWRLGYIYPILGKALISMKSYEEAANAYQEWRHIDRSRANAALQMLYRIDEGLFEEIVANQIEAVKANPDDIDAHHALAQTYESNAKRDEVIVAYEKLSELQPDNAKWFRTIGNLYQQRGETVQSVKGRALRLGGDGSFVDLNDSAALNASHTQLTVEVWIKPTKVKYATILYKGGKRMPDFLNHSFNLSLSGDVVWFNVSPDGWKNISISSSSNAVSLNKWHHIAGVVNTQTGSIKLYIDGIPVASQGFPKKSVYKSHLPLRIGWRHKYDERDDRGSFEGELADIRIWNTARTAQEIQSHMNVTLTGDELGLIGLVQRFDENSNTPPNHLSGKFVGDVEVIRYTRPIFTGASIEHLTKAAEAYERAISLEPTAYRLHDILAKIYRRLNKVDEAEATYRRAIDAVLEFIKSSYFQGGHSDRRDMIASTIQRLWQFYVDYGKLEKGIATLEALKPKLASNAVLHKLLGNAYKKVEEREKSDAAYARWFEIRKKEIYETRGPDYSSLARQLLEAEFMPEQAVKFAKLAIPSANHFNALRLLCRAYIANGQCTEALDEFMGVLKNPTVLAWPSDWSDTMLSVASVQLWLDIAEAGRKVEDRARYIEMIEQLANSMPDNLIIQRHVNPELSKLYSEQAELDKSREQH